MTSVVDEVRRFNRAYTQRIGALDESFLGSGRTLGLSRLLFEIGPSGAGVADLRARLGLDSGYASRMLRQLQDEGLVAVETRASDRRHRTVVLTAAGRAEWDRLDRESQRAAAEMVERLSPAQQRDLAEALRTARRLLVAATLRLESVDPRHDDARRAVQRYFDELDARFPTGFDGGAVAGGDAEAMSPPAGLFVVGYGDGQPVACGGVQRHDEQAAEIKRMWVDPTWRGLGIAKRLLGELEGRAAELGYRRVVLDTNGVLLEAISLYESAGYQATARYNDNPYAERWFVKVL